MIAKHISVIYQPLFLILSMFKDEMQTAEEDHTREPPRDWHSLAPTFWLATIPRLHPSQTSAEEIAELRAIPSLITYLSILACEPSQNVLL